MGRFCPAELFCATVACISASFRVYLCSAKVQHFFEICKFLSKKMSFYVIFLSFLYVHITSMSVSADFSVLSSALISVRFRSVFETILDFNHSLTPITHQGSPSFISLLFIHLPLFVHILPLSLCRCVAVSLSKIAVTKLTKLTNLTNLTHFT